MNIILLSVITSVLCCLFIYINNEYINKTTISKIEYMKYLIVFSIINYLAFWYLSNTNTKLIGGSSNKETIQEIFTGNPDF